MKKRYQKNIVVSSEQNLIKGKITIKDCQKILNGVHIRATINKDLRDLKELEIIIPHGASVNIFKCYTLAFRGFYRQDKKRLLNISNFRQDFNNENAFE